MLVHIQPVQIPQFWEVIKFAALQSELEDDKYCESYCLTLLQDLLSGKKQCFIADKDGKVSFVVILEFLFSNIYGANYLYFNNLYSFEKQDDEVWKNVFIDLNKIAKENDCKAIVGDSNNPRVSEINKTVGARCVSSKYLYMV